MMSLADCIMSIWGVLQESDKCRIREAASEVDRDGSEACRLRSGIHRVAFFDFRVFYIVSMKVYSPSPLPVFQCFKDIITEIRPRIVQTYCSSSFSVQLFPN